MKNFIVKHGCLIEAEPKERVVLIVFDGDESLENIKNKSPYFIDELNDDVMDDVKDFIKRVMEENKQLVIKKVNVFD
jgi:hypothetical protein